MIFHTLKFHGNYLKKKTIYRIYKLTDDLEQFECLRMNLNRLAIVLNFPGEEKLSE